METHASGLEGKFVIRLRASDGVVADVAVESKRRLAASALLRGRPPAEAVRLLPLIYSLCGQAQGVAGLEACERALGIAAPRAQTAARRLLVLAESMAENARRILLDWPELLNLPPELPALVELRKLSADCISCLFPHDDWLTLGGGALEPDNNRLAGMLERVRALVAEALDGAEPERAFRDLDGLETLDRWLQTAGTSTARCLEAIRANGLEGLGAAEVRRLGTPDWDRIAERIGAQDSGSFAVSPDIDGRIAETGPVERHWDHPLIADIRSAHGCGLLARVAARILDIALAPEALKALSDEIETTTPVAAGNRDGGQGHAAVETARGWLFHLTRTEDGLISRYEILAPTDWNFHPAGVLAQGLKSLTARRGTSLREAAELCVAGVDPCTAYEVHVEEAVHA